MSSSEGLFDVIGINSGIQQEVIKPHLAKFQHAGLIPIAEYAKKGIQVLIIDKDSHFTDFNRPTILRQPIEGLKKQHINEHLIGVAAVSNSINKAQVRQFARDIACELELDDEQIFSICKGDGFRGKPHKDMGLVVAKHFEVEPCQIAVAGDRVTSDVGFGVNLGAGEIALSEKAGEGDIPLGKFVRLGEKALLQLLISRGTFQTSQTKN